MGACIATGCLILGHYQSMTTPGKFTIIEPSMQTRQHLPWFLDALPSEDCAKGGAGAYTDALQRSAKESSGIKVGPPAASAASTLV